METVPHRKHEMDSRPVVLFASHEAQAADSAVGEAVLQELQLDWRDPREVAWVMEAGTQSPAVSSGVGLAETAPAWRGAVWVGAMSLGREPGSVAVFCGKDAQSLVSERGGAGSGRNGSATLCSQAAAALSRAEAAGTPEDRRVLVCVEPESRKPAGNGLSPAACRALPHARRAVEHLLRCWRRLA